MFKQKIKLNNQGNIALILVIMVTTLTLVSALTLALINISDLTANYHLLENEAAIGQRDSCLEDALYRIDQNIYATGTYALQVGDINCNYEISATVAGLKTVTTTAAVLSALGYWQGTTVSQVNVSSTPIELISYKDVIADIWDSSSWARRIRISVQPDQVAADVYNFPVYVDLSDLGTTFFDNVQSDAGDIVVTAGDGTTKLLREVQSYGGLGPLSTAGALYFLAPYLSSEVATDFYIYFGNTSANEQNDTGVWSNYEMVQHLDNNPNTGSPPHEQDSTENNNDLTTVGSIPNGDSVSSQIYRGIDFDSGDYFTISNLNDFTSTQGTISFWIKVNTLQAATLFHFYESAYTDFIRAYLYDDGRLDLTVEDGDVQKIQVVNSFNPGTTDWHHVVWTQDGTAVDMYVDGRPATISGTNSGAWWTDHLSLTAGKLAGGSWGNTVAIMDEFRVSQKAMSADWIATEYNNQFDASAFYSTSTIEILACSGVSLFGYCWYQASADSMSCDDVCAANSLSCVSGVSYSDPTCSLNIALGTYGAGNCSGGTACINGTGLGLAYSPANHISADACIYDSGSPAYDCAVADDSAAYKLICACQ